MILATVARLATLKGMEAYRLPRDMVLLVGGIVVSVGVTAGTGGPSAGARG